MSRAVRDGDGRYPRNILHLIDTGGPGGAETVFIELLVGLNTERWLSYAALPHEGWAFDEVSKRGASGQLLPTTMPFDIPYLMRLMRLIVARRIDLIQTHLLGTAVYANVAGLICGVPVVSTFHGDVDLTTGGKAIDIKMRIVANRAAKLVFVSDYLRRSFSKRFSVPDAKSVVIHNGIDPLVFTPGTGRELREEFGVQAGQLFVGAVGNVRPAKSYDTLLRAVALAVAKGLDLRVVIVGDTHHHSMPALLALQSQLQLEGTVTFTGFRDNIESLIGSFDCLLLTSDTEGFSIVTLQALACSVPVIATRCGGPEEIIGDGGGGLLVEKGSPEAIAEALLRFGRNSTLRTELASRGRDNVNNRFTLARMLAAYDALYGELV